MAACSCDVHSEEIIVNVVTLSASNLQVEDLGEGNLVLVSVDLDCADHEADDAVAHRWLVLGVSIV